MLVEDKQQNNEDKSTEPMTTSPHHLRNKDLSSRDLYKHT
jgi:hypothetical protein